MKRLLGILVFLCLSLTMFGQEETRVVDSLLNIMGKQQGREKVKTMIELTWEFYEVSYDDCLDWGEKTIKEAQDLGFADLEARATYVLGLQYAYHGDLDLAKEYLLQSFHQYMEISDTENAFESLWDIATYELTLGNMDSAYCVYEKALSIAEEDFHYARVCIYSNMALIWQNKGQPETAVQYLNKAKQLFVFLDDELMSSKMDFQIAIINKEHGKAEEAKIVLYRVLAVFEKYEDYYYAMGVCKGLGDVFAYNMIDYDSASYFLNKALFFSGQPIKDKESKVLIDQEKANIIVKIADLLVRQNDCSTAIQKYLEALRLAESQQYVYGQLEALKGLVMLHSQLGQAESSIKYYQRFSELEEKSGIVALRPTFLKYLVIDYARLGRFDEMAVELEAFDEQKKALQRENNDLYDQINSLQDETQWLRSKYETQNNKIETLQAQRNHYRLAFFGQLAIALFVVVLFVAYKIVRKKRTKV